MSRRPAPNGNHGEMDPLVMQYSHLKERPREAEALQSLKKIASLVKPLMRARGWKVGTLSEFYPDQQNLLGMNRNRGQVIYLRLRYPGDANQFLPMEQVTDTMLHELSHNVYNEHDQKFHALWDELRKEYEGLVSKGYTGEGFLSDGHRLGGRRIPKDEAHRIRRVAAEKRAALTKGSGQKLGGAAVPLGSDMRKVIADAVERRQKITTGCGSGGNKNDKEIEIISDQASKNGFKTKVEEDQANEAAIAQALWELHQEDEKQKFGNAYVPPSLTRGTSGLGLGAHSKIEGKQAPPVPAGKPKIPESSSARRFPNPSNLAPPLPIESKPAPPRPVPAGKSNKLESSSVLRFPNPSNLISPLAAKRPAPSSSAPKAKRTSPSPTTVKIETQAQMKYWTCSTCTFAENPILHLCCDVCDAEQPDSVALDIINSSAHSWTHQKVSTAASSRSSLGMWACHRCGNTMDSQWWTCSTCGTVKLSSNH